jgi:hypothetical protein
MRPGRREFGVPFRKYLTELADVHKSEYVTILKPRRFHTFIRRRGLIVQVDGSSCVYDDRVISAKI